MRSDGRLSKQRLGRRAGQGERGGHTGIQTHFYIGFEAITDHDAALRGQLENVQHGASHVLRGFANDGLNFLVGASLDSGDDASSIGFAPAGNWTILVAIGGEEPRPAPDGIECDLQFLINKSAVETGNHDVGLASLFGQDKTCFGQFLLERWLTHHKQSWRLPGELCF